MSISHSFSLSTDSSVAEVAEELYDVARGAGLLDPFGPPDQSFDDGVVTAHGMWVRVFAPKPQPWSPVITDLGITPTVSVAFRPDKTGDLATQEDDLVRLVSGLLDRFPDDAVLQYHYETVWLLRRAGDLSLNERSDLWPPHRLATLSQPYRRATHAFADE